MTEHDGCRICSDLALLGFQDHLLMLLTDDELWTPATGQLASSTKGNISSFIHICCSRIVYFLPVLGIKKKLLEQCFQNRCKQYNRYQFNLDHYRQYHWWYHRKKSACCIHVFHTRICTSCQTYEMCEEFNLVNFTLLKKYHFHVKLIPFPSYHTLIPMGPSIISYLESRSEHGRRKWFLNVTFGECLIHKI